MKNYIYMCVFCQKAQTLQCQLNIWHYKAAFTFHMVKLKSFSIRSDSPLSMMCFWIFGS